MCWSPIRGAIGGPATDGAAASVPAPPPAAVPRGGRRPPAPARRRPRPRPRQVARHRSRATRSRASAQPVPPGSARNRTIGDGRGLACWLQIGRRLDAGGQVRWSRRRRTRGADEVGEEASLLAEYIQWQVVVINLQG
jgi:hypothetical protein